MSGWPWLERIQRRRGATVRIQNAEVIFEYFFNVTHRPSAAKVGAVDVHTDLSLGCAHAHTRKMTLAWGRRAFAWLGCGRRVLFRVHRLQGKRRGAWQPPCWPAPASAS